MSVTKIDSDTLIPIEHHFRVSAGPGAGKTHWLVNHIRNVLHQSERLGKARKIACITYTNVAVDTILVKLGDTVGHVDISTIHSFLYKHVIKPYIIHIADEYGLNVQNIDGHDDPFVNFGYVINWIESHPESRKLIHPYTNKQLTKRPQNKEALKRWLLSLHSSFNSSKDLKLDSKREEAYYMDNNERKYLKKECLSILETDFFSYKKQYWKKGILFHDDILFFSYQLIKKFPFVLQILRAKFPYFFVDEFQDTNPIQTKILEQVGQEETIVGIIGDKAQSIYGFQGAAPSQFKSFTLPGLVDYQMADNRRSTNQIIDVLNFIRSDIIQEKFRNKEGEKPTIIEGEMISALHKAQELCNGEEVYSLSRDNITANVMKKDMDENIPVDDFIEFLYAKDSAKERRNLVLTCIKATELARQKNFKEAIKELERLFKNSSNKNKGKKDALKHIILLLQKYDSFRYGTLFEFYSFLNDNIKSVTAFKAGKIKTFYERYSYQQLAVCVKDEGMSVHRTIHKAKGTEFDNVLLVLKKDADLKLLMNPDLGNEEQRIYYVAISRAKNRLFVSVPKIISADRNKLNRLFEIIRVETKMIN